MPAGWKVRGRRVGVGGLVWGCGCGDHGRVVVDLRPGAILAVAGGVDMQASPIELVRPACGVVLIGDGPYPVPQHKDVVPLRFC